MKRFGLTIAALTLLATPAVARDFTAEEQAEVLRAAAALIEQRYVDAGKGQEIAGQIRRLARERRTAMEGEAFADAVTEQIRTLTGDGHLGLSYSDAPIPEVSGDRTFAAAEMEKWYGAQVNHGVEKIERLDSNVMLLDLRVFPPPAMGADVFAAAMTVVAQGDALIIDLRENGGGAETADFLTGYFIEGGSPLAGKYDRPSNTRSYASSPTWVPGRRFGTTKPLFILTSRRTFSAAEAFAYNLQALGRAIVVGEVTGRGAHPFEYRRVHPHFAVDLPEAKSIHPLTGTNWQGTGVKPDVAVPADQALNKALELARVALTGRSGSASDPRSLP
jgi:hypothetical protein